MNCVIAKFVSLILLACSLRGSKSSSSSSIDYCVMYHKHILCGEKSFAAECGKKELIKNPSLTDDEKAAILKTHNDYRNSVAEGKATAKGKPFPQAANMRELKWDDELASVATRYVRECRFVHSCDQCREVNRFSVGENLHSRTGSMTNQVDFAHVVGRWLSEDKDYNVEEVDKFRDNTDPTIKVGHLTQAIWAETKYVGCGYIIYKHESGLWKTIVSCNYGPVGNILGYPVYKRGTPCSSCDPKLGCSPTYPSLCATKKSKYENLSSSVSKQSGMKVVMVLLTTLSIYVTSL